jgi:hypothetical protein
MPLDQRDRCGKSAFCDRRTDATSGGAYDDRITAVLRHSPRNELRKGPCITTAAIEAQQIPAEGCMGQRSCQKECKHSYDPNRCRSSFPTRAITDSQSPGRVCRKRRIVGYHGVSSRSSIQRQSADAGSKVQVGTPSAPAR